MGDDRINGKAETIDAHLQPNPEVIAQTMKNDMVLLNLRTNLFYELNRTAARWWELLCEGNTVAQIRAQMLREFDVEPTQLDDEIQNVIGMMKAEGLVTGHESD
jgi:hypothetical protein